MYFDEKGQRLPLSSRFWRMCWKHSIGRWERGSIVWCLLGVHGSWMRNGMNNGKKKKGGDDE